MMTTINNVGGRAVEVRHWWGFEGNALLGFTLYLLSTVALAWLCRKVWRRLPMPRLAS